MAARRRRKPRARDGDIIARRYRVEQLIAQGGVADVYRAHDSLGKCTVALKLLRATSQASDVNFQRFQREAMLLQRLDHPNVVRTFHHGLSERGIPFIVFELFDAKNLKEQIRKHGAFSQQLVVHVTRQVLLALESAHAVQIVHRDIKPTNILLDSNGHVKLIDFGLAKSVGFTKMTKLTQKGMAVGTPRYMAPEQVRGLPVGETVDLYPVGLVMAEMITGKPLVAGDRPGEIIRVHGSPNPLPLPPEVLRSPLAPVVAQAVGKVVKERYASARQMREALERVAAAQG